MGISSWWWHSIQSLLCTEINVTPHEHMFTRLQRFSNGQSMPTWLMSSGKELMKIPVGQSKYWLVKEVDLVETSKLCCSSPLWWKKTKVALWGDIVVHQEHCEGFTETNYDI